MGRPRKDAVPTNFWEQCKHFEDMMAKIDEAESTAIAKAKQARDELKGKVSKEVLAAVRVRNRAEPIEVAAPTEPKPEPKPETVAASPSTPPPSPRVSNGQSKQQPRAQA